MIILLVVLLLIRYKRILYILYLLTNYKLVSVFVTLFFFFFFLENSLIFYSLIFSNRKEIINLILTTKKKKKGQELSLTHAPVSVCLVVVVVGGDSWRWSWGFIIHHSNQIGTNKILIKNLIPPSQKRKRKKNAIQQNYQLDYRHMLVEVSIIFPLLYLRCLIANIVGCCNML